MRFSVWETRWRQVVKAVWKMVFLPFILHLIQTLREPGVFNVAIRNLHIGFYNFHSGSAVKNPPAMQETKVQSWVGKISQRRKWQPTAVFLPGKSHGQRKAG